MIFDILFILIRTSVFYNTNYINNILLERGLKGI